MKKNNQLKSHFILLMTMLFLSGCVSKKKFWDLEDQKNQLFSSLAESQKRVNELSGELAVKQMENEELEQRMALQERELAEYNAWRKNTTEVLMLDIPSGYEEITFKNEHLKKFKNLGDVEYWLDQLLFEQGYYKNKYLPFEGGFAIMTNIEQIEKSSGASKPLPTRWDHQVELSNSGGNFWERLFWGRSGRFRMFTFLVVNKPYKESGNTLDFEETKDWWAAGFSAIPSTLKRIEISEDYYCDVLVYEFEMSDGCPEGCNNPSGNDAEYHLTKAKLWEGLNN